MSPVSKPLKPPLPPGAMQALDNLRLVSNSDQKTDYVALLLKTAGNGPVQAAYIMKRLLSGISVSSDLTRLNFSILLSSLARHPPKSVSPDDIAIASANHYIDDEYDHDGPSSERERVLGALATGAAVV